MTPEQAETGRIGVELMTAWSAGDEDHGLYRDRLQVLPGESRLDEVLMLVMACSGLADVAGYLLLMLSEATGLRSEELLRKIAQQFTGGASQEIE